MPVTPEFLIATPDDVDPFKLVEDLADTGETVETALKRVNRGANMFVGTAAERATFLAQAPRGSHWQDTDGNQREYMRGPTSWLEVQSGDFRRGTAGQRSLTTAQFGQIWQDTDGSRLKWKGRSNGSWTRLEGLGSAGATAWDTTGNGNAGRTVNVTIPAVLEATETVMASVSGVGSGFGLASLHTVAKNATNSVLTFRHMQLFNTAQNGFSFTWQIVDQSA